jgi:ribosome biogenesis protein SSF1/2
MSRELRGIPKVLGRSISQRHWYVKAPVFRMNDSLADHDCYLQLVMNNFSNPSADAKSKVPKHLESLTTTAFQSLFPPINPQTTPLKSIRRVLLLNREPAQAGDDDGSFVLDFRHYAITTKAVGVSKPLKRLKAAEKLLGAKSGRKGGLPNLNKLEDIADYMIGGDTGEGYMTDGTSGSEAETDAEIEVVETVAKKVVSSKARAAAAASEDASGDKETQKADDNVERRAVKLVELGPRMRLRMTKVEEGMCSGKIMWHEFVHKSQEEIRELEKRWDQRRKEKEERKRLQKENVDKKRKTKAQSGDGNGEDEEDEDMEDVDDLYDYSDEFDSEGLAGDAEEQVNALMEANGGWEDEREEIANS